ncbi:glutathione S-transferase N-terminal domain-containing protein [Prochlorococcus sp. MIT 1223]|uniref:glutathione S-transferase N-terminal domain-containing protein n=1 Tax=Prochlorococcus sp. MIT 1223 TaxID=3096217 RepID=UPI002A74BA79|nr:glutathione S-transferase N-terminal domain-containing protein [Prochlorococcus sp. MIT 1223]
MTQENVLYSFRRCPYAMRARWALIRCKKSVMIREVDLKDKPIELVRLSHKATVPVLITKEEFVIDESLDIIKWALSNSTYCQDIFYNSKKNEDEVSSLIVQNDNKFKYHLDRFKYASRFTNCDPISHKNEAIKILSEWNDKLSKSEQIGSRIWLVSNKETIADWSIWPFVRQYYIADPNLFKRNTDLKYIHKWIYKYLNQSNFRKLMFKNKVWKKEDEPTWLKL